MNGAEGTEQGIVLAVDDEPSIVRHIQAQLTPVFDVRTAGTVADGLASLAELDLLSGAVIDVGLPDGSGLSIAEQVRERFQDIPMMILTGNHEPQVINRVHALGAGYVAKPDYDNNLSRFLRQVLVDPERRQTELRSAIERVVEQNTLSPREAQILSLAISGVPRSHIATVIGVSENTVKTQVRSLLDKCDEACLADLVWSVRSSLRAGSSITSPG